MGLTKTNPNIAHHILPWALREHDVIQKAAKSADVTLSDGTILKPWHMNDPLNGIPLDPVVHSNNHSTYTQKIEVKLDAIKAEVNSNEEALIELYELNMYIKNWIIDHPGISINNIILP